MGEALGAAARTNEPSSGTGWQTLWMPLHVAVLYVVARLSLPWFSGWTKNTLLPVLQAPSSESDFQFLFSHLILFSLILGFVAGSAVNGRLRHRAALFAWVFPAILLVYKIATFGTIHTSVFAPATASNRFLLALHHYFGQDFVIGTWQTWKEFWTLVASNPDMVRGMDQVNFTAPFCAGITYAAAGWLAIRTQWEAAFVNKIKEWEHWKFATGRSDIR